MKRFILVMAAALAFAPAAALADDTPSPAAQANAENACTALQASLGAATFKRFLMPRRPARPSGRPIRSRSRTSTART